VFTSGLVKIGVGLAHNQFGSAADPSWLNLPEGAATCGMCLEVGEMKERKGGYNSEEEIVGAREGPEPAVESVFVDAFSMRPIQIYTLDAGDEGEQYARDRRRPHHLGLRPQHDGPLFGHGLRPVHRRNM